VVGRANLLDAQNMLYARVPVPVGSVLHARGPRGGPVVGASSGEAPSRTTHTDYFVLPNVFIFLRRV